MLIQSFDTPHKLERDLDASVSAGSALQGAGLVVLATRQPGRLLLQPESGEVGSSIDLSIQSAQEIALLSEDAALVLSDDHVLYLVSDLRDAVKVKSIARDVRALSARSHGQSALAVGFDSVAKALTWSSGAVASRAFGLRGELRACDIAEHVTYAVIDHKSGSQLRVHPGTTPELGTSARVTLPEAAARLDRVRGGSRLSALYARGEAAVCVIRGPERLEAKLVVLEDRAADVAVLDQCLLIAYEDGRLALYDDGEIGRASDAPLAPTHEIALSGAGKPNVCVMSRGAAGPTLWIGTSAGEVFSTKLREKPAEATTTRPRARPVPRAKDAPSRGVEGSTPPPPEVGASPEVRARELEAALTLARQEHAEAITALLREHSAALASAEEAHGKELAAKEAALAAAERALSAERDRQRSEQRTLELRFSEVTDKLRASEAELVKRTSDCDAVQTEYEALETRLGMVEEQMRGWAAEIAARTAERDGFFAELEVAHIRLAVLEEESRARDAELIARTGERDQMKRDLERSRADLASAVEQTRAREVELSTRTKERDGSQAELEQAKAEMEREQERAREREREEQAASLRGSEGRPSFGRAGARLDSVISQVQSVLFGRPRD